MGRTGGWDEAAEEGNVQALPPNSQRKD